MKKIFILGAILVSGIIFAQTVKFSKETKAMYKTLLQEGVSKGLSKTDATQAVIDNSDFNRLFVADMQKSQKKLSKEGIIISKNFLHVTNHKKVAILPFSTTVETNKKKQSKKENIKNEQEAMDMLQDRMYKHLAKNQFNYSVEFQDIDRTNQLLRSTGLWNNLSRTPSEEIAAALGVDAVIRGDFGQEDLKHNLMQKAAGTYLKVATLGLANTKSKEATLDLSIADGKTGEVYWRKESSDAMMSSKIEKLVDYIMKSVDKAFPYHVSLFE